MQEGAGCGRAKKPRLAPEERAEISKGALAVRTGSFKGVWPGLAHPPPRRRCGWPAFKTGKSRSSALGEHGRGGMQGEEHSEGLARLASLATSWAGLASGRPQGGRKIRGA